MVIVLVIGTSHFVKHVMRIQKLVNGHTLKPFIYDALIVTAIQTFNPVQKRQTNANKVVVSIANFRVKAGGGQGLFHFHDKIPFGSAENAGYNVKVIYSSKLSLELNRICDFGIRVVHNIVGLFGL